MLPTGIGIVRCDTLGQDGTLRALEAMAAEAWGRVPAASLEPDALRFLTLATDWEGRACGLVSWDPGPDDGERRLPEVSQICVRTDWRGHGLGMALVSSLRDALPEGFWVADDSPLRGGRSSSFWASPHPGAGWHAAEVLPPDGRGRGGTRVRVAWT